MEKNRGFEEKQEQDAFGWDMAFAFVDDWEIDGSPVGFQSRKLKKAAVDYQHQRQVSLWHSRNACCEYDSLRWNQLHVGKPEKYLSFHRERRERACNEREAFPWAKATSTVLFSLSSLVGHFLLVSANRVKENCNFSQGKFPAFRKWSQSAKVIESKTFNICKQTKGKSWIKDLEKEGLDIL